MIEAFWKRLHEMIRPHRLCQRCHKSFEHRGYIYCPPCAKTIKEARP